MSRPSSTVLPRVSNGWRPRFLLIIADPDLDAEGELVSELVRHHVDVEVCAGAALSSGAAACVARPYRLNELIPIMKSIRPETIGTLEPPIKRGGLRLDPATLEVLLHGRSIRLPLREYELLRFFMVHADRVVTRHQIYDTVWGGPARDASNTLAVHIKRLRRRLGDGQEGSAIIVTVRGVGYRFIPPPPRPGGGPN